MDRVKKSTLNISQLAALSGVHRQTAAAEANLPLQGDMKATSSFIGWLILCRHSITTAPVAEGEMDAHDAKHIISLNVSGKVRARTAQLIPASDVRREFAIWAKAVVQVLETLPDILERDCGLQPAAVSSR